MPNAFSGPRGSRLAAAFLILWTGCLPFLSLPLHFPGFQPGPLSGSEREVQGPSFGFPQLLGTQKRDGSGLLAVPAFATRDTTSLAAPENGRVPQTTPQVPPSSEFFRRAAERSPPPGS